MEINTTVGQLMDTMVNNIEECKLQDKNQITVELSQEAHKNIAFQNKETIEQIVSEEEILTSISECVSVASNCNDNTYDDNINVESSNVLLELGDSSQNKDLEKSQEMSENSEPSSINGLSINTLYFNYFYFKIKMRSKHFVYIHVFIFRNK